MSIENQAIQIYSITGALVATYYNNTDGGENLKIKCKENKEGGLDNFSFTIKSDTSEPLFNDMECQIWVDGVHWFTGFAEFIPDQDNIEPEIEIVGKGYFHKLKLKTINETYTSQTLDFIIKDIASTYLGVDINVYYDVAKIDVPSVNNITIEFADKTLLQVFTSLLKICNFEYNIQQYTFGVDKEKELYFTSISNNIKSHMFEGYNYQNPLVEKIGDKIINKIFTYRTKSGTPDEVEFVAIYEDTTSQGLHGLYDIKLTFPDFVDTTTISNVANGLLEKNANFFDRLEIEDLETSLPFEIGFYALSNQKKEYWLTVSDMEDISELDISHLTITTASITDEEVFTGRKALKLVTSVGSAGEYLEVTIDPVIQFPKFFRSFVFLNDTNANITIRLIDTDGNTLDIDFGEEGILTSEWLKSLTPIELKLINDIMEVDDSTLGNDILEVNDSVLGINDLDLTSTEEGFVRNLIKIRIIINNNNASTIYIDTLGVQANTYLYRNLILTESEYEFKNDSVISKLTLGDRPSSLIDEVNNKVEDGNVALSVFSKQ